MLWVDLKTSNGDNAALDALCQLSHFWNTMNNQVYIYKCIDTRTRETIYVGKTIHPRQRAREQTKRFALQGIRIDFEVIDVASSATWADCERYWIQHHKPTCNRSAGGQPGRTVTRPCLPYLPASWTTQMKAFVRKHLGCFDAKRMARVEQWAKEHDAEVVPYFAA